jgi:OpgC protein
MKRLTELDVLRGILLLMMVVNHSPSSLRRFTDQPVGFFTTAEAFVFVSAFLAGILFRKRIEKNGFNAARSSTIHRAGRIYCALDVHRFRIPAPPDARICLWHWELLPSLSSRPENLIRAVFKKSAGSDRCIDTARLSASVDGHPSNVQSVQRTAQIQKLSNPAQTSLGKMSCRLWHRI